VLDDIASATEHIALDALAARQRVIANNMSNIQTPGFAAGRLTFEDSLRSALQDGTPDQTTARMAISLEPTRLDGNNVNLDHETLSNVDTNLRYNLMLRALDSKYGLLHHVISGGS